MATIARICCFGFHQFVLMVNWSKLNVGGYYEKKYCYMAGFDNEFMKIAK